MIISHQYRFIFWKPHKVGSTSVLHALGSVCGDHDTVADIHTPSMEEEVSVTYKRNLLAFEHLEPTPRHAPPADIRRVVDTLWGRSLWDDYLKVTIVRNPWDLAVSQWDYWNNALGHPRELGECLENKNRPYWFDGGAPIADRFLRFERLVDDFEDLRRALGLPSVSLPHFRRGKREASSYAQRYDAWSRDEVARNYALEIEHFGYRFEGSVGDAAAAAQGSISLDGEGRLIVGGSVLPARRAYADRGRAELPGFLGARLSSRFSRVLDQVAWIDSCPATPGVLIPSPSAHGMLAEHVGRLLTQPDVIDLLSRISYRRLLMVPGNIVRIVGPGGPHSAARLAPPGAVASVAIRLDRSAEDGGGTAVLTDLTSGSPSVLDPPWTGIQAFVVEAR